MEKLKRLYPNFLKRIDRHLLLNYPHIWRTRVHDFAWFSLILGNLLAVGLGVFLVRGEHIFLENNLYAIHIGATILAGFVGLFWAIRLLQFKIKSTSFKIMLTTWLIFIGCIASLGLNVAALTSTIAYQTAYVATDKVLQADLEYTETYRGYRKFYDAGMGNQNMFSMGKLNEDYKTDQLLDLMERWGYTYKMDETIYENTVMEVNQKIQMVKEAKVFVWTPILASQYRNYSKRSFFHELLRLHWTLGFMAIIFLPALLFLLSTYGMRNVLISILCSGIFALMVLFFAVTYNHSENYYPLFLSIGALFMGVLLLANPSMKHWSYTAGIFVIVLAGTCIAWVTFGYNAFKYPRYAILMCLGAVPLMVLIAQLISWREAMPVES